jgi:hypothetical protein
MEFITSGFLFVVVWVLFTGALILLLISHPDFPDASIVRHLGNKQKIFQQAVVAVLSGIYFVVVRLLKLTKLESIGTAITLILFLPLVMPYYEKIFRIRIEPIKNPGWKSILIRLGLVGLTASILSRYL